jgi:hypothetical protein
VVEHIEASTNGDGRPGPEEAWAIALASQDERDTVVWTSETAQAWQLARPVMETSGPITARKTFTETYTRLIAAARAQHRPVTWSAHLGWDKAMQGQVLQRAVDQGLLPAPSVVGLLPAPEVPDSALSPEGRAQLAKVKQMLADGAADDSASWTPSSTAQRKRGRVQAQPEPARGRVPALRPPGRPGAGGPRRGRDCAAGG